MIEWSDLQYLLALARGGALSRAAEALEVNRSTVSRRIAALEKALDTRLVERAGRDLILTQSGQEVVAAAQGVEGEVASLERRLFGRDAELAGMIRLTTMSAMAQLLGPDLVGFNLAHPDVVLDVSVTNAIEDIENFEADVALRFTEDPPQSLVGRALARPKLGVYGTRSTIGRFIEGDPSVPLPVCMMSFPQLTGMMQEERAPTALEAICSATGRQAREVVRTNSIDVLRTAVAEGNGFAVMPCYTAQADPRLVRVGEPLEHTLPSVWLLYHPRLRRVARIQAFVQHVVDAFERLRPELEGRDAPAGEAADASASSR